MSRVVDSIAKSAWPPQGQNGLYAEGINVVLAL